MAPYSGMRPTIARERKFYSADYDMRGLLRFFLLGHELTVDVDAINTTAGNGYAFLREFFVRKIYFRAFQQLNFNTCLDLGCNTGVVASLLKELAGPQGRVFGVDPHIYPGQCVPLRVGHRSRNQASSGRPLRRIAAPRFGRSARHVRAP